MVRAKAPITERRKIVDINQAAQEYRDAVTAQNTAVEALRGKAAAVDQAQSTLNQALSDSETAAQAHANAQAATAIALANLEAAALNGIVPESI
jgi:hypothetical protein